MLHSVGAPLERGWRVSLIWRVKVPKRVPPLNAMQVEKIKAGEELIDGGVDVAVGDLIQATNDEMPVAAEVVFHAQFPDI